MTTASIKTTDELAALAKNRSEEGAPLVAPTAEPTSASPAEIKETSALPADVTSTKTSPQDSPEAKTAKAEPNQKDTPKSVEESTKTVKEKPKPVAATAEEVSSYLSSLDKLSFKNTVMLYELRGHLKRAKKSLPEIEEALNNNVSEMLVRIELLLDKNKDFQEQLNKSTQLLLEELNSALEAGKSEIALPLWDKIQGNISNTSGKICAELHAAANKSKTKIDELRQWKVFAATEAKKKLLTQMQHLIDSKMHASDRSKSITAMHKEWKAQGRSEQNEELWKEFKTLSDKAYEPCKEYFKQRKQLMAENFKNRRALCDDLEKEITELSKETVNISTVNKLLKKVEEEWKKHAPVEQSKIKSLQKRYYELLNNLRKLRRVEMRDNAKAKQDCIVQAQKLASLEDNKQAMREAKNLQQQWKSIGPTSFKEDRKYWDEFRAACDKIFEHRNQEAKQLQSDLKACEENLNATLLQLEALTSLDDEEFRASRAQYQTLAQKFSNDLDPRLKQQRKALTDQFNSIKRKIDTRFKALPDKKLLKLKENISIKLSLLEKAESELLKGNSADGFNDAKTKLNASDWNALNGVGNDALDKLLQSRWQNLCQLKNHKAYLAMLKEQTQLFHKQCIDLEIRANMESPEADQSVRMEIQLAQLKNAFGKSKPDRAENRAHAKRIEIESLCWGPIEASELEPLTARLSAAIARLS